MGLRRSWLPLSLVFLAGVLLGSITMATWVHMQLDALHSASPEALDALGLHVLDRQLDLDAGQEQQAREILQRVHERLAAFHRTHGEELHAILRDTGSELKSLLRPDQAAAWDALHERIVAHLLISGSLTRHHAGEAHEEHDDEVPAPSISAEDGG